MTTDSPPRVCELCSAILVPEPGRRGPRRKLCRACATPATYQARWIARRRPDYRAEHNAARRVHHDPRPCEACGLTFQPRRSDSRACCARCGDQLRIYRRPYTAESAAAHIATFHPDAR